MLHMTDVEKSPSLSKNNVCNLWCFVAKYVFCNLRCFGTKSFCRDLRAIAWRKFSQKLWPWRKNYKYEVWTWGLTLGALQAPRTSRRALLASAFVLSPLGLLPPVLCVHVWVLIDFIREIIQRCREETFQFSVFDQRCRGEDRKRRRRHCQECMDQPMILKQRSQSWWSPAWWWWSWDENLKMFSILIIIIYHAPDFWLWCWCW